MQGSAVNLFRQASARLSINSTADNNAAGGHIEKHIWNEDSKKTYGNGNNYFIKISDVRNCFDNADVVVSASKASFTKISENRYEIETIFNLVNKPNFEGLNWKGEKKKYQAVQWVFEKKKDKWLVSTAFPTLAT